MPTSTSTGTPRSADSAGKRLCVYSVCRYFVTVSTEVSEIMLSTNVTNDGLGLVSPKPYRRVSSQARSEAATRALSIAPPPSRAAPPQSGKNGALARATRDGRPSLALSKRPAEVDISATPRTRLPNHSGYCSANAMIVMPPIEWPTRTIEPSGTVALRMAARDLPSAAMS